MIHLKRIGLFVLIIATGEIIATFIFWLVLRAFRKNRLSFNGILRGILERLFIYFSLVNGIFHALTLFGALKIATHIKDEDKISNDYFLVGNLISIFFAIGYFLIYQGILGLKMNGF